MQVCLFLVSFSQVTLENFHLLQGQRWRPAWRYKWLGVPGQRMFWKRRERPLYEEASLLFSAFLRLERCVPQQWLLFEDACDLWDGLNWWNSKGNNCLVCIYPVAPEQLSCILEISLILNPAPEGRRQVLCSSSRLPARSHNWCPVTQALHDRFLLFVPPGPLSTLLYLPYPPGGWPLWTIWPRFPQLWLPLGFSQWEAKRGDWERKERAWSTYSPSSIDAREVF